jgi:hypothetical protein
MADTLESYPDGERPVLAVPGEVADIDAAMAGLTIGNDQERIFFAVALAGALGRLSLAGVDPHQPNAVAAWLEKHAVSSLSAAALVLDTIGSRPVNPVPLVEPLDTTMPRGTINPSSLMPDTWVAYYERTRPISADKLTLDDLSQVKTRLPLGALRQFGLPDTVGERLLEPDGSLLVYPALAAYFIKCAAAANYGSELEQQIDGLTDTQLVETIAFICLMVPGSVESTKGTRLSDLTRRVETILAYIAGRPDSEPATSFSGDTAEYAAPDRISKSPIYRRRTVAVDLLREDRLVTRLMLERLRAPGDSIMITGDDGLQTFLPEVGAIASSLRESRRKVPKSAAQIYRSAVIQYIAASLEEGRQPEEIEQEAAVLLLRMAGKHDEQIELAAGLTNDELKTIYQSISDRLGYAPSSGDLSQATMMYHKRYTLLLRARQLPAGFLATRVRHLPAADGEQDDSEPDVTAEAGAASAPTLTVVPLEKQPDRPGRLLTAALENRGLPADTAASLATYLLYYYDDANAVPPELEPTVRAATLALLPPIIYKHSTLQIIKDALAPHGDPKRAALKAVAVKRLEIDTLGDPVVPPISRLAWLVDAALARDLEELTDDDRRS